MVSGIELLTTTYEQLSSIGAVATKAEFSTAFLGKSPSYVTSMQARGRAVSDQVLETLENTMLAEIRRTAKSDDVETQAFNVGLRRIHAKVEIHRADKWLREAGRARMEVIAATATAYANEGWEPDHSGLLSQMPAAIYWLLGKAKAKAKAKAYTQTGRLARSALDARAVQLLDRKMFPQKLFGPGQLLQMNWAGPIAIRPLPASCRLERRYTAGWW